MRRIEQLITLVRERSRNSDFSTDSSTGEVLSGISTSQILQFFNEAQDQLQAAILSSYPNEFIEEATLAIIGGTEEYTIPDRVFINNKIVSVEYRRGSNLADYCPLDRLSFRDRNTMRGEPEYYIPRSGKIMVNPIPQSSQGDLRVMYYRELDDLDVRRGTVASVTYAAPALTALTLSTTGDDNLALADADYLCVNDRYGNVTMYNIPVSSYDAVTGIVSIVGGSFTADTGETIAAGSYVTIGKYTTTHSKLADNCERFLVLYAQKRLLTLDESNTSVEEDAELQQVKTDILNSYADEARDPDVIPIMDEEIMV